MRNNNVSIMRGRFISCPGDPIHIIYESSVDKDGHIVLTKYGEENTDVKIESYRQSTELSAILSRYANGDNSALNRYKGLYVDLTEYPKNYREALDSFIKSENAFNALPLEIRNKFGNDWRTWLSKAGSEEWLGFMGHLAEKPSVAPVEPEKPVEEVKE